MKNQHRTLSKLLVAVLFISAISCTKHAGEKSGTTNSFYTIPFAEIVKDQRDVKLSELADDVEIIQLDNRPEAFIGNFENIAFTKDYIFVQCWDQPVLQFSRSGKFLKHIGALGKGPGEYNNCIKLSVDEPGEKVYIHTWQQNIMVFNFDGEYLKTISFLALEQEMKYWFWGGDSIFISYLEPTQGDVPFVFIEHNEKGDTLQTIRNHIFWNTNDQFGSISSFKDQNFSYRFENKLHLKGAYNDTVYTYDENKRFVPKFFIDLGKHKLPDDMIYERKWTRPLPAGLCWTGVLETSNYVLLPYGYHFDTDNPEAEIEEKGMVLYNKATQKGVAVKETKQAGFIDDLTGGPDFRPTLTNGNTALMILSAMEMKQYLDSERFKNQQVKFPEKKERLKELGKTLSENDNHFVVLATLKN